MTTTIEMFAHLQIPLEDVVNATNNFHHDNIIGRGGLGTIYKGQLLRSEKLIKISALRVDRKQQGGDIQFWREISMLSDLKHTNLVSIIGFCDEKHEKIIITSYSAKGSLNKHLNNPNLTWTQRLKICVGVARALRYLHSDEKRGYGVMHLNINSSTILLDENWEPKLSGFKVSIKQSLNRMDHVTLSEPIGTIGYVDPETIKTKGVTQKSDVYAYGVVLFELLCGRKAYIKDEANTYLARLAKCHYENETLYDIVHPDLRNQMSPTQISLDSLRIYSKIAYSCLEDERAQRPHTRNIVNELEKALKKALKFRPRPEIFEKNMEHLKIPLDDIKLATHNFSDTYKIVSGVFGTMYEGELSHFDKENPFSVEGKGESKLFERHNTVVIKRLFYEEELFFTELEVLTSVMHHNIVTLIGFCVEGFEMILVTEKFFNQNLCDYLGNINDMRKLTWRKRLKICIDVARALIYLHSDMEDKKMIIHGDINSYRIGLDENWGAKIEDFEFAVFLPPNQEDGALCNKAHFKSRYHVDPKYVKTGKIKKESDVYSFGVVLWEILCGRKANDEIYLGVNENGLIDQVRDSYYDGGTENMIDPILKEETVKKSYIPNRRANKDSLHTFLEVAKLCVAKAQYDRPTMKVVLNELEKALVFQVSQEEQVQQLGLDHVVDELEKPTHEILEEEIQRPKTKKIKFELNNEIKVENMEHLMIPFADILSATDDLSTIYEIATFDNCTFYRTKLEHYDKENHSSKRCDTVLIKRYHYRYDELFGEKQFLTEIEMLSNVRHPNIVRMLGFCVEDSKMILVIDNFSNGFLHECLKNVSDKRILTWEKRLKICIDVAHALKYIHYEMEDQKMIINNDVCSKMIGLDENSGAKIVYFGQSVFVPPNEKEKALYLKRDGRHHYIDPEYKKTGKLKRESDVYGFGVVLFEILCGRLAYHPIYLKKSDKGLAHVARQSFRTGTLEEMIDPIIYDVTGENNFVLNKGPNKDSLHAFMKIAYQCVAETQDQRPTMEVVLRELEKALFFQKYNKDNPRISLLDIIQATQNFHSDNCIGGGGFGKVYKGKLPHGDGFKAVVAKRLNTRYGQGEKQFLSELQILLEYKHENVIGLVGYCDEENEKIIVCEYASKGSLDRYLDDVSLTWVDRLNICIDVASALYFFHGGFGKKIKVIHRDIKSANILLSHDWKAKLADFGLSLISPLTQETDYVIDHACGTHGYLDPVYRKSGFLTIESDIYSFGVVLFELLCGRSTFIIYKHEGHYLPDFIKNRFEEGKHGNVVFEHLREHIDPKSLTTFQKIAYQCLHHERQERPTTKKVLMQLKAALAFQNMASKMTKFALLQIPLEDIVKATNNFHDDNIIGHDGFSTAYKGQLLRSGKLMKIAARRYNCKHGEGDLEFLTEISVLSDLKHANLVSIIGYCDEKEEKITLTTYETHGSLGQYLCNPDLTWTQRLRICVGAARALSYFHYDVGCDLAIIHCNINSDIILLDENWDAKLSGFEVSIKQSVYDDDQVCLTEHIGTMGYMDPKIEKKGGMTRKSDIYSFGVVLFETLCGRKAVIDNEANRFLAPFAMYHYENGTLRDIIHPNLLNQISMQSLFEYSKAAYSCLEDEQVERPNLKNIVQTLEKALESHLRHGNNVNQWEHLKIPLSHIKLATDDFSKEYTIDSFVNCTLYKAKPTHFDKENNSCEKAKNKGEHPYGDNTTLIKRYHYGNKLYGEKEFFIEIEMLSSVKHPNIVTLYGFCVEASEIILVIDNFSNGFLFSNLQKFLVKHVLTWEKRLKICIDVARALSYLHSEMEDQKMIINLDISPYNIGLDEKWRAKIVHFWNSVFLPPNQEDKALYLNSYLGRPSYIDPQYKKTGKLKRESVVYSFGVVLFEILCGRLANDPIYKKVSDKGLAFVARHGFHTDMIDPILKEETGENNFVLTGGPNKNSLHTFTKIAYRCVAETQDRRPTMKVVVKELEKALFFQLNPLVQTNRSTEFVYCWSCGIWKVNTTPLLGRLLRLLGQISTTNAPI